MSGVAGSAADPVRAADAAARRAAQTVFDRPLVIEAGAGTGKTTTLVARLLAWGLGPGWERAVATQGPELSPDLGKAPGGAGGEAAVGEAADRVAARLLERVVAITFTEAAAAEMAGRTAAELAKLAAGDAPPGWLLADPLPGAAERARRAAALLGALDHLRVSTIHAFCLGLLAGHPVEAGLHPELAVDAEGRAVETVVRETVETALRDAYGENPDPAYLALAARGIGPPELIEALVVLVAGGLPAAELARDPLAGGAAAALRDRLLAGCRDLHGLIASRLAAGGGRLGKAREVERALGGLLAVLDADPPPGLAAAVAASRERLTPDVVDRIKIWRRRKKWTQAEADRFGDCEEPLCAAAAALAPLAEHVAALDLELLAEARAVLGPLLGRIERELTARGIVTFQDLLARSAALLADRPDVAARERRSIDQLLVDEFQDTDRLQCALIGRLALDGPAAERPGLFLVGDPKQSIYGWRSADLAAYDGFLARVAAAGGATGRLVENFRSVPAILDEVERVIAPVMAERPGVQPRFEPLVPCERRAADPGFTAGGRAAVELWVSWPDAGPDAATLDQATEVEAEAVARDLVDLHRSHGVPWGEAALLVRSTTDLDVYLEALRRRGVPFAVARDKKYYRRREVIEAAALVRAVLDPGDHLALLTLLRSPMVGVPDAALVPLWRRELPRRLTELSGEPPHDRPRLARLAEEIAAAAAEVPAGIPGLDRLAGWPAALAAAAEGLSRARRGFRTLPADRFVAALRRLFLPEPTEAARYLGPYRLANLERFFTRLGTVLEEGGGDTAAVLRALRRSVTEALDAQEARPDEGAPDAVQVMTIHTAKGLDFAHVYLGQLHKQSGGDPGTVEVAATDDGFEYRLFGAATPGFDRVVERRARVEAAELVRTLYVAMTRAEDRLVLLGSWAGDDAAGPRPVERAESHLDLLAHRPGVPPLAMLWEAGRGEGPGTRERRERGRAGGVEEEDEAGGAGVVGDPAVGRSARDVTGAEGGDGGRRAGGVKDTGGGPPLGTGGYAEGERGNATAWRDELGALWRFPGREMAAKAARAEGAAAAGAEGGAAVPEDAGATREQGHGSAAASAADGDGDGRQVLPSAAAVERAAAELARLGEAAETRRRRPYSAAASEEAHQRLRELAAAGDEDDETRELEGGGSRRRAAMAAGAAVHRALELLDLAADDPGGEAEAAGGRLAGYLAAVLPTAAPEWPGALDRAAALWRRFAAGPLHDLLRTLDGRVIARELPVLLPAPAEVRNSHPTQPPDSQAVAPVPVGFVSGSIDLLYLGEDGRPVVADYKTDAVAGDDELAARAAAYAPQGAVYTRAVAEALGLAALPRFELWFLDAGRVVEPAGGPEPGRARTEGAGAGSARAMAPGGSESPPTPEPGPPTAAEPEVELGKSKPGGTGTGGAEEKSAAEPIDQSEKPATGTGSERSRPTQLPLFDDEEAP